MIWLPLLTMLALPAEAAAPSDDASAPPADAALTSTDVDAKRVIAARALLADDTSRHEAVALLARLAVHGDPAVATEARRALLRVLLASPAKPGWRELYGRVNDVATAEERATLAARARALPRSHTRPPRRVRPMSPSAAARAWRRRTGDGDAAWAHGNHRLAAGDRAGARAPLTVALLAAPNDPARLDAWRRAHPGEHGVVARVRLSLARAPTPQARDALLDVLVRALADEAEAKKAAGEPGAAVSSYARARLVDPENRDLQRGAAGAAWAAGDLEAAWTLYAGLAPPSDAPRGAGATPAPDEDVARIELALATDLAHPERLAIAERLAVRLPETEPRRDPLLRRTTRAIATSPARVAMAKGRAGDALPVWEALLASDAGDLEALRGRAGALAALGRHEEALLAWDAALAIAAGDPWSVLGRCHTLLALGRRDALADALAALSTTTDPEFQRGIREVHAHALRREAEEALAAGALDTALLTAQQARGLDPSAWSMLTEANVLLARGGYEQARNAYALAVSADPSLDEPRIGVAIVLSRTGRADDALADLEIVIAERRSTGRSADTLVAARNRIHAEARLREGLALLEAGKAAEARALLATSVAEHPMRADLVCAAATVELRHGDVVTAQALARRALDLDASSEWAARIAIDAARDAGTSREVLAMLEAYHAADAVLDEARIDALLQEARQRHGSARRSRVAEAESLARGNAAWDRIGAGWLDAGRPDRARQAYERALEASPDDVDAHIGRLRALLAAARLQDVARAAVHAPSRPEARLAVAEAEVRRRQPARAEAALGLAGIAPCADDHVLARRACAERGVHASAGLAVVDRRGSVNTTGLRAIVTPAAVSVPLRDGVRAHVLAHHVQLRDESGEDAGTSFAVGWDTAPTNRWAVAGQLGTSPLGFEGGGYLVGSARLTYRPVPAWTLGAELARAPRTDTRASWAGVVFPATGQRYGRVSEVWAGLDASLGVNQDDAGAMHRSGYVEGIGVAPNYRTETVAWAGHTFLHDALRLRVGADAVIATHDRDEDGQVPGEGGYFSPPLFATGMFRGDARWGDPTRTLCGGLGAGPRYQSGEDTPFQDAGPGATAMAYVGGAGNIWRRMRLRGDARVEVATSGWRQLSGVVQLTNAPPDGTSPATPTLVGAPGLGLPRDLSVCDVLP